MQQDAEAAQRSTRAAPAHADEFKPQLVAKVKVLQAWMRQVGSAAYGKGVVEFLEPLYTDDSADQRLDGNPHLLAFSDAVYDFRTGEVRPIAPVYI